MTTIITTHLVCTKNIKEVRKNLYDLLYFDRAFSDSTGTYGALEDADDDGYSCNLYFLKDKLVDYYKKREKELKEGTERYTEYSDDESECIQFAIESLIEYLQRNTEDRLDYSVKIHENVVSALVTAHIFD